MFITGVCFVLVATWKRHRKAINPAFSLSVLQEFVIIFTEQGQFLINKLMKKYHESNLDVHSLIESTFLNIILGKIGMYTF